MVYTNIINVVLYNKIQFNNFLGEVNQILSKRNVCFVHIVNNYQNNANK